MGGFTKIHRLLKWCWKTAARSFDDRSAKVHLAEGHVEDHLWSDQSATCCLMIHILYNSTYSELLFCKVHILQGMWHCSDSAKISPIRKLSSQHSIATNITSMLEVRCTKHQEEWWRNTSALDPPYPAAIPPRGQEAGQEGAKSGWRLPGRSFSSLPLTGTSLTEHQLPKPRRTSGKLLKGKDRSEDSRQIKWQNSLHNHQTSTHTCVSK